jgi:hypothetical protein
VPETVPTSYLLVSWKGTSGLGQLLTGSA